MDSVHLTSMTETLNQRSSDEAERGRKRRSVTTGRVDTASTQLLKDTAHGRRQCREVDDSGTRLRCRSADQSKRTNLKHEKISLTETLHGLKHFVPGSARHETWLTTSYHWRVWTPMDKQNGVCLLTLFYHSLSQNRKLSSIIIYEHPVLFLLYVSFYVFPCFSFTKNFRTGFYVSFGTYGNVFTCWCRNCLPDWFSVFLFSTNWPRLGTYWKKI